ncbi:MAG: hypothetical protein ACR2NL_05425, partial [Acidimicrobiia bacterium]
MKRVLLILAGLAVVLLLLRALRDRTPSEAGTHEPSPAASSPGKGPGESADTGAGPGTPVPG